LKILLDTHCWLWSIIEPERLNQQQQNLMANGENEIYLSVASIWEIGIKVSIGKLSLPEAPKQFIPQWLNRLDMTTLPIKAVHALEIASLPLHHRDPFDRILIAQAQVEKLPIITVDPIFQSYDVALL
jgi:PIN domain nuclease of toxin-antitoxin system